jgi:predicted murein hydrolase (TIGR00659 family)
MIDILSSPFFGIVLSVAAYCIGVFLQKKTRSVAVNPLLIAVLLIICFLSLFNIPLSSFNQGGDFITLFLTPATAVLALPIYRQIQLLKKNLLPVLVASAAGSAVSMGSIYLLCQLFQLDQTMTASLLPKSVTTPIAIEVSSALGGIPSITVAAVVFTGILGAVLSPLLIKLFRVDNPVAAGIAIGASSHAVGTSKAIELGEVQGAMSGIAIAVSGLFTVLFALILQ